jgi:thioredoxin reductase (NADPH)
MYDLIIIGSGPAGLSAAVYGKRAGLNLLVIEEKPMSGGQILNTYEVDNYLGLPGINGFDMGMAFRAHADKLGVAFKEASVTALEDKGDYKLVHADGEVLETRTVIVATGAEHAKLGVSGEEELGGMGVSYCATCDGAFFRNRTVAVVGGGDVALEDAIYLARTCEKVYLIHRRDELRGANILQEELKALPNTQILYSHTVQAIQGEDMVESLLLKDVKTGEEKTLSVSGIFIAVGIHPNTELLKGLVEMDEAGYVIAGEEGATTVPGIYVAGDIRKKPMRQVITAVADGANAAVAAGAYCSRIGK